MGIAHPTELLSGKVEFPNQPNPRRPVSPHLAKAIDCEVQTVIDFDPEILTFQLIEC